MTDRRTPDTEAGRYVIAALRLRRSIERNRRDAAFAEANEIVYLFDTNVIIFNAFVNELGNLAVDLDNLVGAGEGRAELSKAMARLTADYLFSGGLPGQRDGRGYISVPHFEESLDRASELERDLERRASDSSPKGGDETRAAVAAILASGAPIETKLRDLGELLPKAWLVALDARAHFRTALRECFIDPGRVRGLDRLELGRAAAETAHEDLQPWFNALPRPSRSRGVPAIRGDAQTLATMVNLYRRDEASRGRGRRRLYVLVTNDGAIASAVQARRALLAEEGIPDFVRSPRDYLPMLNLHSMARAMDTVKPSQRMRAEFARVFDTLSSAVEWISVVSRSPDAIERLGRRDGPLRELQEAWSAVTEYVTVLNARHLLGGEKVFAELSAFFTGETERTATKLVETSVRAVRDAHLSIALESALADLRRSSADSKSGGPRRIHLQLIGGALGRLLPRDGDPSAMLDAAIASGVLPGAADSAVAAAPDRFETQILAACVFMAADRWPAAVQAASRAVEMLEASGGAELSEARYLLATCLRFSMDHRQDLSRALALLDKNLRGYSDRSQGGVNWARRLRDEMERGSLLITAAIVQELSRTRAGELRQGYRGGIELFDGGAGETLARGARAGERARHSGGVAGSVLARRRQAARRAPALPSGTADARHDQPRRGAHLRAARPGAAGPGAGAGQDREGARRCARGRGGRQRGARREAAPDPVHLSLARAPCWPSRLPTGRTRCASWTRYWRTH